MPELKFDGLESTPVSISENQKIVLDEYKLIDLCIKTIERADEDLEDIPIFLPHSEFLDTKYNKLHLIHKDELSPKGIVMKGDANALKFKPHACVKYNAFEVLAWLANAVEMEAEEFEDEEEA